MPHRLARSGALIVLGIAVSGLLGSVATAQPVNDLQAQATQLNAQIQANGAKISALGEQINGAQLKLQAAQAQMNQLEGRLRGRAAIIYKTNGQGGPADFSTSNVLEMLVRSKYSSIIAGNDRRLIDRLNQAKQDIALQRDALTKAKADADAAAAQQQRLLAQVTGQLAVLVAQQQLQQQQAALIVSVQRTAPPAADPGNSNWAGPAASGGAGAAVAFAEAQVGKPYQYAGTGPATYDCSGLTMRAWQAGGVSMAHYSGAQYSAFPKVPMDRLQPGDLVFPSDPGAHVGIYIGGGMMIHATHTGDFVRRDPISQSGLVMTQAVRPG
jgi:cell wall-associated NlpC family hydrolase